jgi:hypothetical protein
MAGRVPAGMVSEEQEDEAVDAIAGSVGSDLESEELRDQSGNPEAGAATSDLEGEIEAESTAGNNNKTNKAPWWSRIGKSIH